MSFKEALFKSTPNFKWKENITEKSDCYSASYQFDCYKDKKNNVILITTFLDIKKPQIQDYHISLINLNNNEVVNKLKGPKDRVFTVRYFQDKNTKNDYFISEDKTYTIMVWDLGNEPSECKKLYEVVVKYEGLVYSCLLMFDINKIYAVTSSLGQNNITKVIDLTDSGKITDITNSQGLLVYYLDYWYNENAETDHQKHVIIQAAKNKILLTEFPNNTTYHSIDLEQKYPYVQSGIVFKNKNGEDLFAFSATYGLVQIINLANKQEVFKTTDFVDREVHLHSFVKWNEKYLLLNDCQQSRIIVFDMEDGFKIKSKVVSPEMFFDRFMMKIQHPKYGESLLSIGIDWKIKLFVNRNYIDE